jgi:hypothetical protein
LVAGAWAIWWGCLPGSGALGTVSIVIDTGLALDITGWTFCRTFYLVVAVCGVTFTVREIDSVAGADETIVGGYFTGGTLVFTGLTFWGLAIIVGTSWAVTRRGVKSAGITDRALVGDFDTGVTVIGAGLACCRGSIIVISGWAGAGGQGSQLIGAFGAGGCVIQTLGTDIATFVTVLV